MVKKNAKRKMRGKGDDVSEPKAASSGGDPFKFEGGDFASELSKIDAKAKLSGHEYARAAVSNPHTTNAFAACFNLIPAPADDLFIYRKN